MQAFPVVPRTLDDLKNLATAPGGKGMSEAVPWVAYDTLAYVSAATVQLAFFQTVKDVSLSNMPTAGAFPSPQFFEPYYVGLDVLTPPQTEAQTAILDMWGILFGTGTAGQGGPTCELTVSAKEQFTIPLSFLHGSGGPTGFGWSAATSASTTSGEWANNSVPDGGWPIGGNPIIPPTVGFKVTLEWPAAVTLSADRDLRVWVAGTLHRRIL